MHYRQLGTTNVQLSAVGLGCNNFGHIAESDGQSVLQKALDLGITFFDTANTYGDGRSEECLGRWLGSERHRVLIATKFGHPASITGTEPPASRSQIIRALEDSLKRLSTEWIDIYQIHFPDPATPIEETLEALTTLVASGKVRHIGCSNFDAMQLDAAMETSQRLGLARLASCQNEYSLLARDIEPQLLPAITRHHCSLLPFFPLASGLLTGKYSRESAVADSIRTRVVRNFATRFLTEANWQALERLAAFCRRHNCTMTELALSWLYQQPVVGSVIVGATSAAQVEQNVKSIGWRFSADACHELQLLLASG